MTTALHKKWLLLGGMLCFSLYFIWRLQTPVESLSLGIVYAKSSFPPEESALGDIIPESDPGGESGTPGEKPSLKEEIDASKGRLSKTDYKAARSNYKQMVEHIQKLERYKRNPFAFDNQGILRNAPTEEIRRKIIQARIRHLETEIQAFYNNIIKIIR